jgi:hypothetical protein
MDPDNAIDARTYHFPNTLPQQFTEVILARRLETGGA